MDIPVSSYAQVSRLLGLEDSTPDLRISWCNTKELRTSSLYATGLPGGPVRILLYPFLLCVLAVVTGIAIENGSDHAQLLCTLNLEASEDAPVARNGNLAFQADIGPEQILKVLIGSVVDVNNGASNIPTGGVTMESRNAVIEPGCRVLLEDILSQRSLERNIPA